MKKHLIYTNDYSYIMKEKTFYTDYRTAIHWFGNNFILCNNIIDIDNSVLYNIRFSDYDDKTENYIEIFEYFLTNCSESEVDFLEKHFGLLFSYSDALDLFILCVDHYGTSWDYVPCEIVGKNTMLINNIKRIGKLM